MTRTCPALFVILVALAACGESRPPAPGSGESEAGVGPPPLPPGSGRRDGGNDGGIDGSTQDAAVRPVGCIEAGVENQFTVQQSGGFVAVPIQSAYASWDCARGNLVIAITDGSCDLAVGTQLQLAIASEAINTTITVGPNFLVEAPADTFLSAALFFRNTETNVFGTCTGTSGSVTFESLDDTAGSQLSGTFDMILTSCDGDFDPEVFVLGGFQLELPQSFSEACPAP